MMKHTLNVQNVTQDIIFSKHLVLLAQLVKTKKDIIVMELQMNVNNVNPNVKLVQFQLIIVTFVMNQEKAHHYVIAQLDHTMMV